MPFGKDGGLHVYHDQVFRAIHDESILPSPPQKNRYGIMYASIWKHTSRSTSWTKY